MPTPEQHALLSASSADRWLHCPASVRLCESVPDETSPYAEEGRLAHSLAELKLRKKYLGGVGPKAYEKAVKKIEAHELYQPEMQWCTDEYVSMVDAIVETSTEHQMWLEERVDYSAYAPGGFGTSDCTVLTYNAYEQQAVLHVVDYKNGKGVPVSAEDNPQLKLYALGAYLKIKSEDELNAMLYGAKVRQIDVIGLHVCQPRSAEGSSDYTLTVDDLLHWAETVVKPTAQVAYEGGTACVPGHWCKSHFCPIRSTCRPRAKHVLAVMFDDRALADKNTLTPDEIGELLSLTEEFVPWRKGLQGEAWKMANSGQAVAGWKLVKGRSDRVWKDPKKAAEALMAAGVGSDKLYTPMELISPAQVEGLLGKEKFAELMSDVVTKGDARPTLAPENDRRRAVNDVLDALNTAGL